MLAVAPAIADVVGRIPYRMALAGGWIDQPFCSRHNPSPPGSMVVVSLQPSFRWMERAGMATGTRHVARRLWGPCLPIGDRAVLVRALYEAENRGKSAPSGTQDMVGLLYPGISRLDYDAAHDDGIYPCHIESTTDPDIVGWVERTIHVLAVGPRPGGYDPLVEQHITPDWVERLGRSGALCYQAILCRDVVALGAAMNECMDCWAALLPRTLGDPLIDIDLRTLLHCYRSQYPGAMYSGCGGGYLYIASERPVPGAFDVQIRLS